MRVKVGKVELAAGTDETDVLPMDEFQSITAPTCGSMGCETYTEARLALLATNSADGLNNVQELTRKRVSDYQLEGDLSEEQAQKRVDADSDRYREIAQAISQQLEDAIANDLPVAICATGYQVFESISKSGPTVMLCGADVEEAESRVGDPRISQMPVATEVKVFIG